MPRSLPARRTAALLLLLAAGRLPAQQPGAPAGNRDPERVRIVTEDIARFWRAYDGATLAGAAERFQRDYLDAGTAGLRDYARGNGSMPTGRHLAATVAARPRYYAAVRATTLAFDTSRALSDALRAGFRRVSAAYPEAVFPDVHLVVGRLQSGGTVSPRGLLVGAEMYAAGPDTPRDELTAWERSVVESPVALPALVFHELIHFQQVPDTGRVSLLSRALREGAADFLAELLAGTPPTAARTAYGDAHEAELWAEFAPAMRDTATARWLYGASGGGDRPRDLGYYVGYRISAAFYRRAADKRAALGTLMRADDPERVLRESGYAPRAGAAARGGPTERGAGT